MATLPPLRLFILLLAIGSVGASLVGCGSGGNGEKLGERVIPLGQPVPKGGGRYATGVAYKVDGVWYQPREDAAYDRVGTASWYGELFHGRRTANGEIYDMERLSAASTTLPMPVYARVTNLENRRSIIVRVNDRGPYRSSRIMDVSRRSAEVLGFRQKGTARVRVQYLARAPLNGDDSYERRYLASQSWAQVASRGGARDHDAVGSIAAGVKRPAKRTYQAEPVAARAPERGPAPRSAANPLGGERPCLRCSALRAPGQADTSFRQARSEARTMPKGPGRCSAASPRSRSLRRRPVVRLCFASASGLSPTRRPRRRRSPRVTEAGYRGAKIVTN